MNKLWPIGARVDENGELWLGDCAASELVRSFGTPLYVFDENTLRARARAYQAALRRFYPGGAQTAYAAKAYLSLAIAELFAEEGLDLDVVSGGELAVALKAGFPAGRIHFHGNNKLPQELEEALTAGISRIVVDNFHELELLAAMTGEMDKVQSAICNLQHLHLRCASAQVQVSAIPIWLRLSPGIQAHTHSHIQTGHLDTKFGFPIATGDAERAVVQALQTPGLSLVGLHCHIGSQIYETEVLAAAASRLIEFAAAMRDRYGFVLQELSPGGGWGVPMTEDDPDAPIDEYVATMAQTVVAISRTHGLELPRLVLEPGRSLIAPAAVALYTVGSRKEIPGVRTYVSVDGGMADNIRPALYGAKYVALRIAEGGLRKADWGMRSAECGVRKADSEIRIPKSEIITIVGKFCETGDILIRDVELPRLKPGDLLAIPMAGAYTLAMSSNYNLARRPAVVLVKDGEARLIQRRESYADLMVRDLSLHGDDRRQSTPEHATRNTPYVTRRFWKYQALGNDYIVLDPADWPEPPGPEAIRRICDRHRGVGADGILWGSTSPPTPLRLFNPDGSEFEKSGNGLRIFARYLWDRGYVSEPDFEISTPGGVVTAHVLEPTGTRIALDMGTLSFDSAAIPVAGPRREVVAEPVTVAGHELRITAVTIGNPHCVVFVDGQTFEVSENPSLRSGQALEGLAGLARTLGPQLEHLSLFPNRTNVQFAQALDRHTLRIEIWERGAGYTLASGSSSCAAAGAAIRTGRCVSPVTVLMPGGAMLVEVAADWSVRLTGTVGKVCEGVVSEAVG